MFGKLLKHDFKTVSRSVLPSTIISIIITGVSALLVVMGRITFSIIEMTTASILYLFFAVLLCFALLLVPALALVFLIIYFKRSSYGTNAPLTRTLPVPQELVYDSKTFVSYIWLFVTILLSIVVMFFLFSELLYNISEGDEVSKYLIEEIGEGLKEFPELTRIVLLGGAIGALFFIPFYTTMVYQFCFVASNHFRFLRKMNFGGTVLTFIFYYVLSQILNLVSLEIPVTLALRYNLDLYLYAGNYFYIMDTQYDVIFAVPFLGILFPIVIAIVLFILNRYWYSHKVNIYQ